MNKVIFQLSDVDSSSISYLGYNGIMDGTGEMNVWFRNGLIYKYYDVEFNVFLTIVRSESIGSAFNKLVVKNTKYLYEKVWFGLLVLDVMNNLM